MAEDEPQQQEPSQEELIQQLEAELKKLKVADVLVQTIFTVSSLGFAKLREDDGDLDQAKLAIESLRALVPSLEGAVPAEVIYDVVSGTTCRILLSSTKSDGRFWRLPRSGAANFTRS